MEKKTLTMTYKNVWEKGTVHYTQQTHLQFHFFFLFFFSLGIGANVKIILDGFTHTDMQAHTNSYELV
jgi:hypothetical protein